MRAGSVGLLTHAWLQGYVDVAQHRDWVQTTGGSLYHYHPWHAALDYDELLNDLLWNVRREQALEAMLRVRCSQGFDVDNCVGAFLRRETGARPPPICLFSLAFHHTRSTRTCVAASDDVCFLEVLVRS